MHNVARLEAGHAKVSGSARATRVVATEMTRGQHSTFGRLTYSTSSFLRLSFRPRVLPSLCLPPTSFATDPTTRSLARSLVRARESFALIAPHAQGDEVTALFVCHPPATCFALLLNVRVREEKRTESSAETVPGRTTQCNGRFPPRHVNSIYHVSILLVAREKLSNLLCT